MRDIKDRIRESIDRTVDRAADGLADKTGKNRTGFNPEVCKNCRYRGDPPLLACQLCGCPTMRHGTLDQAQMTPEGCPRAAEHERRS